MLTRSVPFHQQRAAIRTSHNEHIHRTLADACCHGQLEIKAKQCSAYMHVFCETPPMFGAMRDTQRCNSCGFDRCGGRLFEHTGRVPDTRGATRIDLWKRHWFDCMECKTHSNCVQILHFDNVLVRCETPLKPAATFDVRNSNTWDCVRRLSVGSGPLFAHRKKNAPQHSEHDYLSILTCLKHFGSEWTFHRNNLKWHTASLSANVPVFWNIPLKFCAILDMRCSNRRGSDWPFIGGALLLGTPREEAPTTFWGVTFVGLSERGTSKHGFERHLRGIWFYIKQYVCRTFSRKFRQGSIARIYSASITAAHQLVPYEH